MLVESLDGRCIFFVGISSSLYTTSVQLLENERRGILLFSLDYSLLPFLSEHLGIFIFYYSLKTMSEEEWSKEEIQLGKTDGQDVTFFLSDSFILDDWTIYEYFFCS